MSLFQSNLRKQIRNLPKILNFVKIIHYYSKLFTGVLRLYRLRLLALDPQYTDHDVAAKSLSHAREAFASARRYVEGTWKEYQFGEDVPGWIRWALHQRRQKGLREIPMGPDIVRLPGGEELDVWTLTLREPLRDVGGNASLAPPATMLEE